MPRKLAIRRIQSSELTFFQPLLERIQRAARTVGRKGSKQKAINLDAAVFIGQLYPGLAGAVDEYPVKLEVYGPDDVRVQPAVQLIKKTAKNWRMEGSTIRNPPGDPARYDSIQADDFLILEFADNPDGCPERVIMQIIRRATAKASGLEPALDSLIPGNRNMAVISEPTLATLCAVTAALPSDPLSIFNLDEEELMEDVESGDAAAAEMFRRRGRNVSQDELRRTQETRDRNGQAGERLVSALLDGQVTAGELSSHSHDSEINAVQPYDFKLTDPAGGISRLDVKSTAGRHEASFHMSAAEVAFAATSAEPYHVYRVSELTSTTGILRRSSDVRGLAGEIAGAQESLPEGVRSSSFTIQTSLLNWDEPVALSLPAAPATA